MATRKRPAAKPSAAQAPAPDAPGRDDAVRRAPVRWTDTREAIFFATLAGTANVSQSAKAAGMLEQAAYKRRQSHPEFRDRWLAALRDGYARVELMLLEKALGGQLDPATDRVLLALLAAHRGTVKAIDAVEIGSPQSAGERIKARLDRMAERLGNRA